MNKNKIVVRIQWWLWNQMFQYAYAYALSKRNWCKFLLDISTFDWYKIRHNQLSDFEKKPIYAEKSDLPYYERISLFNKNNIFSKFLKAVAWRLNPLDYREKSKWFEYRLSNISRGYVIWYFQSDKYFREYKEDIYRLFEFKNETENAVSRYISDSQIDLKNSVLLHVRRWDFQTDPNVSTVPIFYYFEVIKKFFSKNRLVICSDDVEWCKKAFKDIENRCFFVEDLWAIETLCLMSKFKNYIISNSTFSRWWAYLSREKDKKVIRPDLKFDREKKWVEYCKDHYPEEWISFKVD